MPVYEFKASDRDGQTVVGKIGAATRESAIERLRARVLTPIRLKELSAAPRSVLPRRGKARVFVRNLSLLLQAKQPVEHSLSAMAGHSGDRSVAAIANAILAEVRGGATLSGAMLNHPSEFPPHFAVAVEAGQASGSLGAALSSLAEDEERRSKLLADLLGALAYPVVLGAGMIGATTFILLYVLPTFGDMFKEMGAQTPPLLTFMLGLSAFLKSNWLFLVAGIAVAIVGLGLLLQTTRLRLEVDRIILKAPIIGGIATAAMAARFFRVLALLLRNGQTAAPAIAAARRSVTNVWARGRLDEAFNRVKAGQSVAIEIAQSGVLPPLAGDLLRASEDAGVLAEGAERLAALYEDDLERRTKLLVRVTEPVMVGLAGLLIGSIMVSIVSALISINETVAR